ncbi:MAG: hypothetical protein FWH26_11055, partial [Oscillospiraceae bacterium]|nr:hypothetical protein [Oscillospiraceae bacterium]
MKIFCRTVSFAAIAVLLLLTCACGVTKLTLPLAEDCAYAAGEYIPDEGFAANVEGKNNRKKSQITKIPKPKAGGRGVGGGFL